ncbi:translation machinery associated TMA7-domain-containing protein [Mycena vulgaris]|nr:translation machinery associated TMA7-domain-containing protein [Mycena vulgaris]
MGKTCIVTPRRANLSARYSQGGKLKPLKAAKKEKKADDEDDVALKAKQKADADALKIAREKALKGGAPGGGIKKSGKK